MTHRRANRVSPVLCIVLALVLLLPLAGCGAASAAQLKAGQKRMKDYLGRGASLTDSHVDVLRPDADKLIASDYVKGSFRAGGETYEFAVNTVTGEVYTSERLAELTERIAARIAARLGLNPEDCVTDCLMELYKPAWQEEHSEWPWERAYLGHVLPTDVADLNAYAADALADEDTRILLYLACRADELYEGRWTADDFAGWEAVEVHLFGFAADEPLPAAETFPRDYFDASDRPQVVLNEAAVRYYPGTE